MNMDELALRVKIDQYRPEKVEHNRLRYKYQEDHEEMAYWATVFSEKETVIEPENIDLRF